MSEQDLAPPLAFYKEARKTGNFEAGIKDALTLVLASPKFLYRTEEIPERLAPGASYRVSDLELASRLSFFLWSGLPDDELLNVAAQGKLKDPDVLEKQVRRMLADPKSKSFSGQ